MQTPEPGAKIVVVVGPTAVGKSDLAIRLAEECGGEIVNADSLQVYRGMDIGTAKTPPSVRRRIPHHLIDILEPDEPFSAADFRKEADRAIADIVGRGKRVVVVGGTGLYIRALLHGLADSPSGDGPVRRELEVLAREAGPEELHRLLAAVDPASAARLSPRDQLRVIRALEVYRVTGRPMSAFLTEHRFAERRYRALKIGLNLPREDLYRRIDERVDHMMEAGLVAEVMGLLGQGLSPDLKPLKAIGYKEICGYLAGAWTLEEAVRLIKRNTRHYAKRQLTWFKSDPEIIWLDYPDSFATISGNVIEYYD